MPELQVKFELIDGATDQVVDADLADGETILGAGINIKASSDVQAGSVVFLLDGVAVRTESVAPYAMFGDSGGDFDEGMLAPGTHTLTAEFFSEGGGNGVSLGYRSITFVVADPAGGAGNGDGDNGTGTGDTDGTQDAGDTDGGPQAGDFVLAVNAGGGAVTTSDGVTYQADTFGAGGSFTSGAAVAGTQDDAIYQSETWGNFTYEIELDPGTYDVKLNFAEIWGGAASAGQRVFDVLVEGNTAVEGLDLSGAHGFNTAVDFIGEVEVTDGFLTIEAMGVVQNAKLSGFSVWQASGDHGSAFSVVENPGGGDTSGGDAGDGETGGGDTGGGDTGGGDTGSADGLIGTDRARIEADSYGNRGIQWNEVRGFDPGTALVDWADQIVFHYDGNNNDEDDIAALPVSALLAAAGGLGDKIEFLYANNFMEGTNEPVLKELDDTARFAESIGIETKSYEDGISAVTDHLVTLFNSGQKVLSIEGGPMEAVYRALEQTDVQNHENIVLLSHNEWNEDYSRSWEDGSMSRNWHDIKRDFPNVKFTEIRDQNWGTNNDSGFYNENWLNMNNSDDPVIRAARDVMEGAQKFNGRHGADDAKWNDASDAGMMWFALTGEYDGTAQDALAYLDANPVEFTGDVDPASYVEDPEVLALFA